MVRGDDLLIVGVDGHHAPVLDIGLIECDDDRPDWPRQRVKFRIPAKAPNRCLRISKRSCARSKAGTRDRSPATRFLATMPKGVSFESSGTGNRRGLSADSQGLSRRAILPGVLKHPFPIAAVVGVVRVF